MSRFTLGAAFAGGSAWVVARLAVARFVDEEVDRHGWISAAGDSAWSSRRTARPRHPVALVRPQPQRSRSYFAA